MFSRKHISVQKMKRRTLDILIWPPHAHTHRVSTEVDYIQSHTSIHATHTCIWEKY